MSLCKVHERGVCFVPAILLQYFSVLNLCFVEQVEDVCMGPKELLSTSDSVRPSLLIDASAIDPQTCCYLAKRVADCKLSFNSSMYISICVISNLQGILFPNENCKIKCAQCKMTLDSFCHVNLQSVVDGLTLC